MLHRAFAVLDEKEKRHSGRPQLTARLQPSQCAGRIPRALSEQSSAEGTPPHTTAAASTSAHAGRSCDQRALTFRQRQHVLVARDSGARGTGSVAAVVAAITLRRARHACMRQASRPFVSAMTARCGERQPETGSRHPSPSFLNKRHAGGMRLGPAGRRRLARRYGICAARTMECRVRKPSSVAYSPVSECLPARATPPALSM